MKNTPIFEFLKFMRYLVLFGLVTNFSNADIKKNYSYLYFENGFPNVTQGVRRPSDDGAIAARANPDLVIQTGYYSMMLECDTMKLSGFDALSGTDYLTALTSDVDIFTEASLQLYAYIDNDRYTCTSGITQDGATQHLRFIEGGQYVQRFDHLRVVFTNGSGDILYGRLEITAWPDHVTFKLDMSENATVTRSTVLLVSPDATNFLEDQLANEVILSVVPHQDEEYLPLSPASYITSAVSSEGQVLTTSWDDDEMALKIDYLANSVNYITSKEDYFECDITLVNPTSEDVNIPLIFNSETPRAITGTMMMLCDSEGLPLGIPVQVSKNWHTTLDTIHKGQWLRGYTMMPLAAGETKDIKLRVVYGYWGNGTFGAVSHSSLSLIGWSETVTWKWDEAALGSWGESMTFDISQHAAGAVIADIRPTFTPPLNSSSTSHDWTENVGGGDFLTYVDSSNEYRPGKKLKTCYRWNGPNLTEVLYSGVTSDDKIRFTYTTRGVGTLDYHRRFNAYKYEFLEDVISPKRLVFYQMAADYYPGLSFDSYAYLGSDGAINTVLPTEGNNVYLGGAFPFNSKWFCTDDDAYCSRGILSMSSTLNGAEFETYIHPYGRRWGTNYHLFDLSAASTERSYVAGDVVEGELEFILPPKIAADYWGEDAEYKNRLENYTNSWDAVHDEYTHNLNLDLTVHSGTLLKTYPVEIDSDSESGINVLADFTVNSGGIGHVPVVLHNVTPGHNLKVQRFINGVWTDIQDVVIDDHDYYQAYYNASNLMDYAFSIKRETPSLDESWRVRIKGEETYFESWMATFPELVDLDPNGDSDEDGYDTLMEYMLNADPTVVDQNIEPEATLVGDQFVVTFSRLASAVQDTEQVLQYSNDLNTWYDVNITGEIPNSVNIGETVNGVQDISIGLDENLAVEGKLFYRLKVTSK